MRGRRAQPIQLTEEQQAILEALVRSSITPQRVVERARVILLAAQGETNENIAKSLGRDYRVAAKWRKRWAKASDRLCDIEQKEGIRSLRRQIETVLADAPRKGRQPTFSSEQIVKIVAIACQDPAESGYPVSHWTAAELAQEAIRRGIVETISRRHVGRFLKGGGSQTPSDPLLAQSPA